MNMMFRTTGDAVTSLGPREFRGVAATSALQADGYALVMRGGDLSRFADGGPLLADHDKDKPVGLAWLSVSGDELLMRGTFAPLGTSPVADQKCALLKAGVLKGISLGFVVDSAEPIVPGRPSAGERATRWTALEVSITALPMDSGAVVTARALASAATGYTRAERELIEAAADHGEALTDARIARIVAEASWCGQSPAFRYRQMRAAATRPATGTQDHAERLAKAERFREMP